jgi:hypothetical protein
MWKKGTVILHFPAKTKESTRNLKKSGFWDGILNTGRPSIKQEC